MLLFLIVAFTLVSILLLVRAVFEPVFEEFQIIAENKLKQFVKFDKSKGEKFDGLLEYFVYGDKMSSKVVIIFHGHCSSGRIFKLWDKSSFSNCKVICPSLPGWGKSTFTKEVKPSQFSKIIKKLIEKEKVESFHLIGISVGATFATSIAQDLLHKVESLTLIAPVAPISYLPKQCSLLERLLFTLVSSSPFKQHFAKFYARKLMEDPVKLARENKAGEMIWEKKLEDFVATEMKRSIKYTLLGLSSFSHLEKWPLKGDRLSKIGKVNIFEAKNDQLVRSHHTRFYTQVFTNAKHFLVDTDHYGCCLDYFVWIFEQI